MNNEENKPVRSIRTKIITIGDGAVGKTSIVRRYLGWEFQERYLPTIGANFYTKEAKYENEDNILNVEWTVWDISGQPAFREVRDKYYLGARGALVVFDITRTNTAENSERWVKEFYDKAEKTYPIVLIGNKVDLRGSEREEVSSEMGKDIAGKISTTHDMNVPYIETSAKTNINLNEAFRQLALGIAKNLGEI